MSRTRFDAIAAALPRIEQIVGVLGDPMLRRIAFEALLHEVTVEPTRGERTPPPLTGPYAAHNATTTVMPVVR